MALACAALAYTQGIDSRFHDFELISAESDNLLSDIVAVDIDNDNDIDIVGATSTSEQGGGIFVYENKQNGQWNRTFILTNVFSQNVYVANMDTDELQDIVTTCDGGTMCWFKNLGECVFDPTEHTIFQDELFSPERFVLKDVHHDGHFDIVSDLRSKASKGPRKLIFLEGNSTGGFLEHPIESDYLQYYDDLRIDVADMDMNGCLDIVVAAFSVFPNGRSAEMFLHYGDQLQDGSTTCTWMPPVSILAPNNSRVTSIVLSSLNQTAAMGIVMSQHNSGNFNAVSYVHKLSNYRTIEDDSFMRSESLNRNGFPSDDLHRETWEAVILDDVTRDPLRTATFDANNNGAYDIAVLHGQLNQLSWCVLTT